MKGYKSQMNALGLSTSTEPAKSDVPMFNPLSIPTPVVKPLVPSNNPGAMTSPSAQGPVRPGTQASRTKSVDSKR